MKDKGFTLIGVLVVIALLGTITFVVALNAGGFFGTANNETATNETIVTNSTIFEQLSPKPISSLNTTELEFMVNYCTREHIGRQVYDPRASYWATLAIVYQNQIIINELTEQP